MKSKFAVVVFAASASMAFADGNSFLSDCKVAIDAIEGRENIGRLHDATSCLGLLQGIRDMNDIYTMRLTKEQRLFCIPQKANVGQLARVAIKHLEDNPADLHLRETLLVTEAFIHAYPCE